MKKLAFVAVAASLALAACGDSTPDDATATDAAADTTMTEPMPADTTATTDPMATDTGVATDPAATPTATDTGMATPTDTATPE